jgi:acetyl-CoA carboxylase biotin carboxyl carrier protein
MPSTNSPKFDLDSTLVKKLAKLLEETGLSEIEYSEGDKRIRCVADRGPVMAHSIPVGSQIAAAPAAAPVDVKPALPAGRPVPSPMVGTVYLAPEPNKPPFFKKGDKVKEGDTLLIIEAMKVMNPIKAPIGGTIVEILVSDAKPVEFGETLIVIA